MRPSSPPPTTVGVVAPGPDLLSRPANPLRHSSFGRAGPPHNRRCRVSRPCLPGQAACQAASAGPRRGPKRQELQDEDEDQDNRKTKTRAKTKKTQEGTLSAPGTDDKRLSHEDLRTAKSSRRQKTGLKTTKSSGLGRLVQKTQDSGDKSSWMTKSSRLV